MSQIAVRHEVGDRFRIQVRGHDVIVDQPASGDAGPTPTELFVAGLASCAAFFARRFLSRHGLADAELGVTADFAFSEDHTHVAKIALRIDTPRPIPPELEPALLRVVEHCTVHESLRTVPTVSFAFVAEGDLLPV